MPEEWKEPLQKCIVIPQRYILGLMGFLAVINAYTMRNCLSLTITEMVTPKDSSKTAVSDKDLRDWSEVEQGIILGAFYWGYIITHIPGGILAEKKGGKYTLSAGILFTAIFTLLTPIVIEWGDWPALVALRILEGLGEGTTFPALNALLAHWIPKKDRSKMGCLVYAGVQIGIVIANISSGFIIEATGTWSWVFYIFGGLGILWCVFWQLLCFSDPRTHPYIRDEEKEYLIKELYSVSQEKSSTPWRGILSSMPVWALVFAQIGHDWIFFTMVSDLPKYIKVALDFKVSRNGVWTAVPYMVMWVVSMSSGFLVDWLIVKKYVGVTNARKIFTTIGGVLPSLFVLAASYAGRDKVLVIFFFSAAMGTMGAYYAGMRVNALDLTSNYAGTVMALENGIGATSGILTSFIIGVIISQKGDIILKWRLVFWIALGFCLVTSVLYIIFASGEEQYWNNPVTYKENRDAARAAKEEKALAKKTAKEQRAGIKQAEREERARIKQAKRDERARARQA